MHTFWLLDGLMTFIPYNNTVQQNFLDRGDFLPFAGYYDSHWTDTMIKHLECGGEAKF